MNEELFEKGLDIRKSVLGPDVVEKSIAAADEFNMPMQKLVTEYCWGAVWTRARNWAAACSSGAASSSAAFAWV